SSGRLTLAQSLCEAPQEYNEAMLKLGMLCACLLVGVHLYAADVALPPASKNKIEFARDIEPLLAKRCFACHGPQQQMSGLRLDQRDAALKGGKSGVDLLPGK